MILLMCRRLRKSPANPFAGIADFAWLTSIPEVGERALAAYGGAPDAAFLERARLARAFVPWHEVDHGVRTGQEGFVTGGLEGVLAHLP